MSAVEAHQHLDELLAAGITPERLVAMLKAVSACPDRFARHVRWRDVFRANVRHVPKEHVRLNMSGRRDRFFEHVRWRDRFCGPNMSEDRTCFGPNMSAHVTPLQYMRKRRNMLKSSKHVRFSCGRNLSGFFDVLAGSLAKAGHPGIRAAQFEDLGGLLARYEKLTGSPPDERTADYIAGRVSDSRWRAGMSSASRGGSPGTS